MSLLLLQRHCRFSQGAYGLSGLVRNEMQQNVLSGDVFIFIGRRGNKIKLLQWDSDGFALYEKGLEQGTFERPPASHNDHFASPHSNYNLFCRV
ncbi:MAG: IS66 family insertion sequence element accessory protein TnpB [Sphingobacteriales bacterium]|nr:IS66 family insertion sequence element accessory protein TnpB [Sphingobacteriales bacterium]